MGWDHKASNRMLSRHEALVVHVQVLGPLPSTSLRACVRIFRMVMLQFSRNTNCDAHESGQAQVSMACMLVRMLHCLASSPSGSSFIGGDSDRIIQIWVGYPLARGLEQTSECVSLDHNRIMWFNWMPSHVTAFVGSTRVRGGPIIA